MATPLSLKTEIRDGTVTLIAAGEIDLSNIEAFDHALGDVVARDGAGAIVDLSGVEYVDSGAINALFAHAEGINLIVNPILMPALTVSGLTDVATVEPAAGSG